MLSIQIICVGKLKEKFYTDASNEYIKRLSGYCKLNIYEIPEYRVPAGSGGGGVGNSEFGTRNSGFKGDSIDNRQRLNGASRKLRRPDSQIALALDKERAAIEERIPDGAVCIALCVEGCEMDSRGLSGFLSDCGMRGSSRLCFIIGGSYGLHENIKNKADIKLSMSKMTFPHNLARVMLLEQLYRAFKIIEGGKYHK